MNERTDSILMGVALALTAVLFYFWIVQAVPVLADSVGGTPAEAAAR
jgi:hypothetical protein